jgi:murein DD-endopeptidase MepM/ murein hydrolase activator NlpD
MLLLRLLPVLTLLATATPTTAAGAPVSYRTPVPGAVVRGFEAPPTPYAAGHRGVDLATTPGEAVRTAAPGTVSFAGMVAGRGVVVVLHADGIRTEYEPVSPAVAAGDTVAAGTVLGSVAGTHGDCAPGGCLHWGARRGEVYFDPLTLLNQLGPVRLLPWDAPG